MAGYLSQEEVDALLKGVSNEAAQETEKDAAQPAQSLPQDQQREGFTVPPAGKGPKVEKVEFAPFKTGSAAAGVPKPGLGFFKNITLELSGELGATEITVRDFLRLAVGSVLKLDKMAGESAVILLNGLPLGRAEVVVINDRFGLRVTSVGPQESKTEAKLQEEKNQPANKPQELPGDQQDSRPEGQPVNRPGRQTVSRPEKQPDNQPGRPPDVGAAAASPESSAGQGAK